MKTKRNHEGYLLIDHRESPGVSDEAVRSVTPELPPGTGRGTFEAPTITCSHCQQVVIVRPDRTRERAYCAACDHYICDECAVAMKVSGVHRSFRQVMDDIQERATRGLSVPIFQRT